MTSAILLAALIAQPASVKLNVADAQRQALVVAPSPEVKRPPLVLAFHGHGGSSRAAQRKFGIEKQWKEALVIYPQGITGVKGITDPEGARTGWQKRPGDLEDRDLKFVDALLNWAFEKYHADPKRVFAAGHSNGSAFTWVLHSARNEKFAAFAGACGGGPAQALRQPPKPVFVIGGTRDQIVPFESVKRFAEGLKKRNECGLKALSTTDGIERFGGKQPVWTWFYAGGHNPPDRLGEKVVEFFRAVE